MGNSLYKIKQSLLSVLSLAMFLLTGGGNAAAESKFSESSLTKVIGGPSLKDPYIRVRLMIYDKDGWDAFFTHACAEGNNKGPAVYVDGHYICSPDKELAWPGGDGDAGGTGNPSDLDAARPNDGWWGNEYSRTINGVTYTVKFWNPALNQDSWYHVDMFVFISKMQVGSAHSVKVKGKWRINTSLGKYSYLDWQQVEFSTTAKDSRFKFNPLGSFNVGSPSAVMSKYGKMKISGNLPSGYGTVTVGTYKGANSSNLGWTDNLTSYGEYKNNQSTFSNLELGFEDRSDYYNTVSKYVEYRVTERMSFGGATMPEVSLYQWYVVSVPGYIRAKNNDNLKHSTVSPWKKEVKLEWETEGSGNDNGTWSVYCYPAGQSASAKLVASNIEGSKREALVTIPEFDKEYTYDICFIPVDGEKRSELTRSVNHTMTREWSFSNFKAEPKDAKIHLSWSHTVIGDASGNKPYSLILQRSDDNRASWKDVKSFSITSANTNDGVFDDSEDMVSNHLYYYRLKINLLDTDIYSNEVSARLGGSEITEFTATRGSYSNMVKLQWKVKQVGTNVTNFSIQRRPMGSTDEKAWADIYNTSGTASVYSYDDVTATPGSFNEYKVLVWSKDGNEDIYGAFATTDGFSLATGTLSGNITYGTGTAVDNVKVTLKRQDVDGEISSGMRSVKFSGAGSGMKYECDSTTIAQLLGGDFSVQMYLYPDSAVMKTDGTRYLVFDVVNLFTVSLHYDRANKSYKLGTYISDVTTSSLSIPANRWSHITCVRDSHEKTVTFYVADGDSLLSEVADSGHDLQWDKAFPKNGTYADCMAIGNSGSFDFGDYYEGYIDEFRLFTKVLTKKDILNNYNHPLAGNELGLAIYYPFDEGLASQTLAYDFSKTNGVSNGRHAKAKVAAVGSKYVPNEEQLSLMAYTDSLGYYVVRGIPFSDEGTSYSVVPTLGIHEFSPSSRSRFISMNSLINSGIDFEDISSFPVSGKVFYAGTDYPVEGANFYVDGTICAKDGEVIETNEKGEFTISVPIGDHFIQVKKNGHVFASAGRYPADPSNIGHKITFNQKIDNLEFIDETLVNFTGRVAGGSKEGDKTVGFGLSTNNIGVTELVLSPLNTTYRLNVVKNVTETTYSYDNNGQNVAVSSDSKRINSKSWRTGGVTKIDCQKIVIRTDSATGEFSAKLPPLEYKIESMKVVKTGLAVGESQTIDLTNPLLTYTDTLYNKDGSYELYEYNTMLNQVYHSDPVFNVVEQGHTDGAFGLKSYTVEDEEGKIVINDLYRIENGVPVYKYHGAIYEKDEHYYYDIEAYEEYVNSDGATPVLDHVPLGDLVVTIDNALSDKQPVYIEDGVVNGQNVTAGQVAELESNQLKLDSLGKATYHWVGGFPNISEPYTRTINISYDIEGRPYTWSGNGMEGVILGSLPTGNNFVTSGPDMLDMILRDPPGSKSTAQWTKGSVTTRSTSNLGTWNNDTHVTTTSKLGVDASNISGALPGVAKVNNIEAKSDLEVGVLINVQGEAGDTWSRTVETTKTISTSDAMEYVGAQGDIFIGTATNIIFGKSRNIGFRRVGKSQEAELNLKDVISTGLQFSTEFSYTQNYIENVLIPNLKSLRNGLLQTVSSTEGRVNKGKSPIYLTTLEPGDKGFGEPNTNVTDKDGKVIPSSDGPSYTWLLPEGADEDDFMDSVMWYNNQIDTWKRHLAFNEMEKARAYELREEKDSVQYQNYSFDSGSSITMSTDSSEVNGSKYSIQVAVGVHLNRTWGIEISKTGVIFDVGTETSAGYHREEESSHEDKVSFSYTLAEEGDDDALTVDVYRYGAFSPIFRTRGGQTSAPYEGKVKTKYYEEGTVIMDATMQIEVPQIGVDVNTVTDIPSGGTANYTLRLSNASQIDEDVYYRLLVNDESNPDGANLLIDGKPITDSRIIKVPAGTTVNKALQLKQTNTSILDYEGIEIVLASQSQFDPTSTWAVIADTVKVNAYFVPSSSPVDLTLSNTLINTNTSTDLDLTFSGFDRSYRGLKAFRLQYKKQGSTDWTLLHEYVLDKNQVGGSSNREVLPDKGGSVTYTLPMKSYTDGKYLFRVLSVSTYGTSEVYRSSQEIALVKDMVRPTPLGQPEPADGVLEIGEDLSITFNEPFLKGDLTQEANFKITGVLNGATIDHETALSMQDNESAARTQDNISLADKSFSIDAWVNVASAGTILSHGTGINKLTVAVDDAGYLIVTVGRDTLTSSKTMPMNKWAFLTMSYQKVDDGGSLSATVASDADIVNLITGEDVAAYNGNGPIVIGKQISGAIHELLLWDEAHDMSTALLNRSRSKNPSTRHLIGYWKMNEGSGKSIRDYARNRHMFMDGETWHLENVNKAISLDGQSYLKLLASDSPYTTADDYAIEFWMRAGAQEADAQLIQAGSVSLWLNAAGQLKLSNGNYSDISAAPVTYDAGRLSLTDNVWHHIALNVLRQGAAAVYVDGQRTFTTSSVNVGYIATDYIFVGARRSVVKGSLIEMGHMFKGQIDEVRVWDATLDANRLLSNRKLRLTGTEDGLVYYYPFETKMLDQYNQVVTAGTAAGLTDTLHVAQQWSAGNLSDLTYTDQAPALMAKPTETNVSFTYVASDTKVVITINEDPASIEGTTLNLVVRDVSDENGNYSLPALWSAFVHRNELEWQEDQISVVQNVTGSTSVSATIVNKGGSAQMWELSGMPEWLTASADYGTLNPLGQSSITFTVDESTPIGNYVETVYLKGNNGIETPLTLNISVTGNVPDWSVNPSDYETSMNVIGSLSILGVPSFDENDIVAAFVGDECRGIAHPEYNQRYDSYFVTMDIYGGKSRNGNGPDTVTFRAYDASTGNLYPVVDINGDAKGIAFAALSLTGKYDNPVAMETEDLIEQTLEFNAGWNWISLYVDTDNRTVPELFAPIAGSILSVKSHNAFLALDEDLWGGNLTGALTSTQMYAVEVRENCSLRIIGKRIEPSANRITVVKGWNWIGYYGRQVSSVTDAFAGLSPVNGDIVKAQRGISYYDVYEWIGSLRTMVPGVGYQFMSEVSANRTFSYPAKSLNQYAPARGTLGTVNPGTTQTGSFQVADYHNYPDNAIMTAQLVVKGSPVQYTGVEVGVFVNDECRSSGVTDQNGMVYLTIPGDESAPMSLKIAYEGKIVDVPMSLTYQSNATYGKPKHPLTIELTFLTGIGTVSDTERTESVYDIMGREFDADSQVINPGLYIIDGRKKAIK